MFTNIYILGVPEGEDKEKETERIFEETLAKKLPKFGEIHESHSRSPKILRWINIKKSTVRHSQTIERQRQIENLECNKSDDLSLKKRI